MLCKSNNNQQQNYKENKIYNDENKIIQKLYDTHTKKEKPKELPL